MTKSLFGAFFVGNNRLLKNVNFKTKNKNDKIKKYENACKLFFKMVLYRG